MPDSTNDVVVYMWNYKQKDMDFTIDEAKILELKGKGINVMIPESYYKYVEKASNKSLL